MKPLVEPSHRRAIVVLNRHDVVAARSQEDFMDLRNDPEVAIAVVDPTSPRGELEELLALQDLLVAGKFLIQSPSDKNTYLEPAIAVEDSVIERCMVFTELAQALGARNVTYEEVTTQSTERSQGVDASLEAKITDASASVHRDVQAAVSSRLTSSTSFPGSTANTTEAEIILASHGLSRDPQMKALVSMRGRANAPEHFEQSMVMSRETKSNLSVAARAAARVKSLNLGRGEAEVKIGALLRLDIEVHVGVDFGGPA